MWLAILTFGPAAQAAPFWDFDTRMPDWRVDLGIGALVPSPFPASGQALEVELEEVYGGEVWAAVFLDTFPGDAWVVTHEQVTFDAATLEYGGPIAIFPTFIGTDAIGYEWWAFGNGGAGQVVTDVPDLCGTTAVIDLQAAGTGTMTLPPGTMWVDNFTGTGAVCAGFVDGDLDGRCPQGLDLDSDGECTSDGEPWLPGEVADCDDAVVGPACLRLTAGPVVPGGTLDLEVAGAAPGETVWFAASSALGSTCPAALGGVCLGLASPKRLGSAVADANGDARLSLAIPAGAPSGAARWLQAVVIRGGLNSDVSGTVQAVVP